MNRTLDLLVATAGALLVAGCRSGAPAPDAPVAAALFEEGPAEGSAPDLRPATASATAPLSPSPEGDVQQGGRFVFVWLRTGPADLSPDESKVAFDGHFANMDRLAQEGTLLVAGPLGEPKAAPDHRGIYLFDAPDVASAAQLAATDPAVAAGVFVFDAEPFTTDEPLRLLLAEERAATEAGTSGMRSYVIASCADVAAGDAAIARLRDEGLAFLPAHIGAFGGQRSFCVLDAETADDARDMLEYASGGVDPGWSLSPWWGSKTIERLASLAD